MGASKAVARQQPTIMTQSVYSRLAHRVGVKDNKPSWFARSSTTSAHARDFLSASALATSKRTSPTSISPISPSSSEDTYIETDNELSSDTDVDEEGYSVEGKGDEPYSYSLQPALRRPFKIRPDSMDEPWPYTFRKGDTAYAKTSGNTWRLVILRDSGHLSSFHSASQSGVIIAYTAQWVESWCTMRTGTFCPMLGNLKPDTSHIRNLLASERK